MKTTWVQDAKLEDVISLIERMTTRTASNSPKGSKYKTGVPKSRRPDEMGIYFEDPTAEELK